jgi:2-polyprenyl-3-methyl-5-hydroxy-6-metoxy-1,4-benzoquinol methylase
VSTPAPQAHWQNVYQTKRERDVSWFQESPAISLDLIRATGIDSNARIVDIGGGASRLVDALIAEGFKSVTVLDLSEKALATSRTRLGALGAHVSWVVADVTKWQPVQTYDLWHDRAAFHFLTEPGDQAAYADCVRKTVRPGEHVAIGTFALDGPERCSGLPVVRHDAASLGAMLGASFKLVESRRHDHQTPAGAIQRFQFSRFVRETVK